MLFVTCLFTYFLTYSLTPRSTVLLEKLTGSQLVQKFPAFYETWKFTTAFTRARHLSWSRATSIKSMTLHHLFHFLKIHLNIIIPSTPGFPKRSLSLRFPHQNHVCTFPLLYTCHMPRPTHYSRCDDGEYFISLSSSNCRTWKEEHSLDLGRFHHFFRPWRPLGRVEV
jgi:hypothetical protein